MRITIVGVAALVAVGRAAVAGSILYATAATHGGVDSFCLARDGSLTPTPKQNVQTAGATPRRLLIAPNALGGQTLYVAEADRIEAFPIMPGGALKSPSQTKPVASLDPRDLAFAPPEPPDPNVPAIMRHSGTLYATHHGYITAYQLDAEGNLPDDGPTSCVQGAAGTNYLDLQVRNGLLYATADDAPGRVEVYGLNCDGTFPASVPDGEAMGPQTGCDQPGTPGHLTMQAGTDCGAVPDEKKNRNASKFPYSERARIQKPKGLVVTGDTVYVEERALRKIIAFRLQPDGTFCDRKKQRTTVAAKEKPAHIAEDCTGFVQLGKRDCEDKQNQIDADARAGTSAVRFPTRHPQCTASRTAGVLQYEGLVLDPDAKVLIGAQFFKGRVDSYRLRPEPRLSGSPIIKLPKQPTATSTQDPRMTPVRLTVSGNTAYVAAGELDRVVAYRLTGAGVLAAKEPFSRTDEQKDSFPNDVAVAMLSAACE